MSDPSDPLLDSLKALPSVAPDDLHASASAAVANPRSATSAASCPAPGSAHVSRLVPRIVPTFCVGATAMYLFWALDFSSKLYGLTAAPDGDGSNYFYYSGPYKGA